MKQPVPVPATIEAAMKIWSNCIDVAFSTSVGTKNLELGGWSKFGAATTFTGSGTYLNNYAILFNSTPAYGNDLTQSKIGNWGGWVDLHELGHVLGLKHPMDKPTNTNNGSVNESEDLRYTIMYDPATIGAGAAATIAPTVKIPLTPGMQDIADLQFGNVDKGIAALGVSHAQDGPTNYIFKDGSVQLGQNNAAILIAPGKAVMTLFETTGLESDNDIIDASTMTTSVYINLNAGHFSAIGTNIQLSAAQLANGVTQADEKASTDFNVGIANGSEIEDAKGGNKADLLVGDGLTNKLYGYDGNDSLFGGAGADWLYGGIDIDKLYGGDGSDHLYGEAGNDFLYGNVGNDNIEGGDGVDTIGGGQDDDVLKGGLMKDTINGGKGNDTINGGEDNDTLSGDEGNDAVTGGFGSDTVTGGIGADTFIFNFFNTNNVDNDVVTDFSRAEGDKIDLSLIDAIVGTSYNDIFNTGNSSNNILQAAYYTNPNTNVTAVGQIRFSGNTLYGDVNGDKVDDFHIVFTGVISLNLTDIIDSSVITP